MSQCWKAFSFRELHPLTSWQGALPVNPTDCTAPNPHYRLVLPPSLYRGLSPLRFYFLALPLVIDDTNLWHSISEIYTILWCHSMNFLNAPHACPSCCAFWNRNRTSFSKSHCFKNCKCWHFVHKFNTHYYYCYNHFTPPCTMSGTSQLSWYQKGKTRKVKPIWIYQSKRQWVAVASAGPYANLHLAPER